MRNRFISYRKAVLAAAVAASVSSVVRAADVLVSSQSELTAALNSATPGTNIVLRNGVWSNLSVNKQNLAGTPANPITIRAQTPGQVAITGSNYFFDVGGHDYVVTGLTFKDENNNLKSIRFRGTNSHVYDNAVLMGGRYNQILYDVTDSATTPTSSFDHNFLAGKQDRGCELVLDSSLNAHIKNNYFGHRPTGGPSGQTNGWETIRIGNSGISTLSLGAQIENNYFESAQGEAETISDKTMDNIVRGNTFKDITKGWVTARLGGRGVYEDNKFINALGIRVGNSDDTIADHPGLIIRNNYIEGPNAKILSPGYQTDLTVEGNTVVATAGGAYNGAEYTTGRFPFEYTNTNNGTINNNIFTIVDATYAAVQAGTLGGIGPTATGGGNIAYNYNLSPHFASTTPTAIRNLFSTVNPQMGRDASGLLRPLATGPAAGKGYQGTTSVLSRTSDVGPSWLDPVMRMNAFTAADFRFDGTLGGTFGSTVQNNGYLSTPATLRKNFTNTDLHSADAMGVSGRVGDRAYDNRAILGMGNSFDTGSAVVADRTWFRDLQAFTIAGWFKTDGNQTIGNGAVLMQQIDANGGWSLTSTANGRLTMTIAPTGSSTLTVNSNSVYTAQNDWTFFAVTFDARPSSNEVQFYVGSPNGDVVSAGQGSANASATSDLVTSQLVIGDKFDGLLDNMRLFTARKDITWIDEDGTSYTRSGNNHDYAVLNLAELQTLRAFDLGINQWNVDANGAWSDDANWVPDAPDAIDASANFTKAVTAQRVVTVDAARTVGHIKFGSGSYSVVGSSTITLQVASGTADITVGSTPQSISAPLRVLSNLNLIGSCTLTLGAMTNNAGLGVQTNVNAGAIDGSGSIAVASSNSLRATSVRQAGVTIDSGGTVQLSVSSPISRIGTLAIAGGTTPTATLDVNDNDLILTSGSQSTVEAQIAFARNGGAWDRPGITSTAAKTNQPAITTLGVLNGAEYATRAGTTDFDGFTVAPGDVLVKYTYNGDANFSGTISFDDYVNIDIGFNTHLTGWANGDFNYDGAVNFDDYVLIDIAFNAQNGTLARAVDYLSGQDRSASEISTNSVQTVMDHFEQFGLPYAQHFLAAVPEPATALVMALPLLACRRRRRFFRQ